MLPCKAVNICHAVYYMLDECDVHIFTVTSFLLPVHGSTINFVREKT